MFRGNTNCSRRVPWIDVVLNDLILFHTKLSTQDFEEFHRAVIKYQMESRIIEKLCESICFTSIFQF